MEYQEKYRHAQPTSVKTRLSCYVPMKVPPGTASKAPNVDHPTPSEKSSLNSFSQSQPVTVSHQDADGFCVPSASPLNSAAAWLCNETIVKPSQNLRKNRCALNPTVSAFNFSLQCNRPKSLRTTLRKWLVLALCIPMLSACAGPTNLHRAENLGARQCVATVLLCNDCRY